MQFITLFKLFVVTFPSICTVYALPIGSPNARLDVDLFGRSNPKGPNEPPPGSSSQDNRRLSTFRPGPNQPPLRPLRAADWTTQSPPTSQPSTQGTVQSRRSSAGQPPNQPLALPPPPTSGRQPPRNQPLALPPLRAVREADWPTQSPPTSQPSTQGTAQSRRSSVRQPPNQPLALPPFQPPPTSQPSTRGTAQSRRSSVRQPPNQPLALPPFQPLALPPFQPLALPPFQPPPTSQPFTQTVQSRRSARQPTNQPLALPPLPPPLISQPSTQGTVRSSPQQNTVRSGPRPPVKDSIRRPQKRVRASPPESQAPSPPTTKRVRPDIPPAHDPSTQGAAVPGPSNPHGHPQNAVAGPSEQPGQFIMDNHPQPDPTWTIFTQTAFTKQPGFDGKFVCNTCNKPLSGSSDIHTLRRHLSSRNTVNDKNSKFTCRQPPGCNEKTTQYTRKFRMDNHINQKHPNQNLEINEGKEVVPVDDRDQ